MTGALTPELQARLETFLDLVRKWNPAINLVSPASLVDGWQRHVLDSAQLWPLAEVAQGKWLDIGSGGGFPGVVMALFAAEFAPAVKVTLVESDRRKCAFLNEAIRTLGLDAQVLPNRSETLAPFGAQVISARALAPLSDLLSHAHRHLAAGGVALFPKGKTHQAEILAAQARWRFHCTPFASKTDSEAVVLRITNLESV